MVGPKVGDSKGFYGGGTGGYTRNMSAYLSGFESSHFEFVTCFHSIRQSERSWWHSFPVRFFRDVIHFLVAVIRHRPKIVHVMAQYRNATPRELFWCWIANLFRRPVFYEIKAGVFDARYKGGSGLYRWMIRRIINSVTEFGVEGRRYQRFLKTEFGRESVYLPNVCLNNEIPPKIERRFNSDVLQIMFVGFCYEGKGTFELVEGCIEAASKHGCQIELILAGHQAKPFEEWLAKQMIPDRLTIHSLGRVDHSEVLRRLKEIDVFCLPSRHVGEGHNNSVNEAMMCGAFVLCTRHGFLGDILSEQFACFLDEVSEGEIAKRLIEISESRDVCAEKALKARSYFEQNFTSKIVFSRLEQAYQTLSNS